MCSVVQKAAVSLLEPQCFLEQAEHVTGDSREPNCSIRAGFHSRHREHLRWSASFFYFFYVTWSKEAIFSSSVTSAPMFELMPQISPAKPTPVWATHASSYSKVKMIGLIITLHFVVTYLWCLPWRYLTLRSYISKDWRIVTRLNSKNKLIRSFGTSSIFAEFFIYFWPQTRILSLSPGYLLRQRSNRFCLVNKLQDLCSRHGEACFKSTAIVE